MFSHSGCDFLFDEGQYKRRNGARIAPYRLIAKKCKKSAFLVKIAQNDGIVIGISIDVWITGQIGFGDTYLDTNLLVDGLHGKEVFYDGTLLVGIVPLPSALLAVNEDAGTMNREMVDEFEFQMLIEDEHFRKKLIPGEVVDFPYFAMCARYELAGLNQFQ